MYSVLILHVSEIINDLDQNAAKTVSSLRKNPLINMYFEDTIYNYTVIMRFDKQSEFHLDKSVKVELDPLAKKITFVCFFVT